MQVAFHLDSSRWSLFESLLRRVAAAAVTNVFLIVDDRIAVKERQEIERICHGIIQQQIDMQEVQGSMTEPMNIQPKTAADVKPSSGTDIATLRSLLNRVLNGGVQPFYTLLESHNPKSRRHTHDDSMNLLNYLLTRHVSASMNDPSQNGRWEICELMVEPFLKMDDAVEKALNLFPQATDTDRNMSLYGLLNKCRTAMGSRMLEKWIKQPLTNNEEIVHRQNYVELFMADSDLRSELFDTCFKRIPDIDKLINDLQAKATKTSAAANTIRLLVALYDVSNKVVPSVIDALSHHQPPNESMESMEMLQQDMIQPLMGAKEELQQFEEFICVSVDMDALRQHEYRLNPALKEELQEVDQQIRKVESSMDGVVDSAADELGLESGKTIKRAHTPQIGHHLKITRKNEKAIRQHESKYHIVETRKDGVYFTTVAMRQLSEQIHQLHRKYEQVQEACLAEAIDIAISYVDLFMNTINPLLTQLDVYVTLAHVAANAPNQWVRPVLKPMGTGVMDMKQARHPLIECVNGSFIPNDLTMERESSRVLIVTGPNMAGKSTYIRQTGLITVMAQIGCFVPCDSATISIVDSVLVRVGAGDQQLKGVSTFMAEMLEASSIMRTATENSLVIIDELGRGTSTGDGFGLAWAITEHLATTVRCLTLFATHFAELTVLAQRVPSVHNLHVEATFEDNQMVLLYQVRPGPCDKSFGVDVACFARFPPQVVELARKKLKELESLGGSVEEFIQRDEVDQSESEEKKVDGDRDGKAAARHTLLSKSDIECTPPSSQDGRTQQTTTTTGTSKRVTPDSTHNSTTAVGTAPKSSASIMFDNLDETAVTQEPLEECPTWMQKVLYGLDIDACVDEHGNPDHAKIAQILTKLKVEMEQEEAANTTTHMEIA